MKKPQVIVSIGGTSYLLPDDAGVATVIKTLSRAVPVWDHRYKGEIEVMDREMEVSMSYVTKSVRYTDKDGRTLQPEQPSQRKPRALQSPTLKLMP